MTHFIVDILGSNFINVQSSSMEDLFADTMNKIPLTFILSVGADPLQQLLRFSQ